MAKLKKAKKKTKIKAKPKSKQSPAKQPPVVTPHPTAGKKVSDFEAELDNQLNAAEQQPPKRGPGRPPKDREPVQQPGPAMGPELQVKVLEQMVRIPFAVWSETIKVEQIRLADREAADLAAATKQLLDYYIPNLPPVLIIWSNFAMATLGIFGPRLALIQQMKKEKNARPVQQTTDGSQPGQEGPAAQTNPGQQGISIDAIKNPPQN